MAIPEGSGGKDGLGRIVRQDEKSNKYVVVDSDRPDKKQIIGKDVKQTPSPPASGGSSEGSSGGGSGGEAYQGSPTSPEAIAAQQAPSPREIESDTRDEQAQRRRNRAEASREYDSSSHQLALWEADLNVRSLNNPLLQSVRAMLRHEPQLFSAVMNTANSISAGLGMLFADAGIDEVWDEEAEQLIAYIGNINPTKTEKLPTDKPNRIANTTPADESVRATNMSVKSLAQIRCSGSADCYRANDDSDTIPLYLLDLENFDDHDDFIASIDTNGRPVIFLVHGFNEDIEEPERPIASLNSIQNYESTAAWFNNTYGHLPEDQRPVLIGVLWESGDPNRPLSAGTEHPVQSSNPSAYPSNFPFGNYVEAQEKLAPAAGQEFGAVLADFAIANPDTAINFIAHSMGNPMSLQAIQQARYENRNFRVTNYIGLQPAIEESILIGEAPGGFGALIADENAIGRIIITHDPLDISNNQHIPAYEVAEINNVQEPIGLNGVQNSSRIINVPMQNNNQIIQDTYDLIAPSPASRIFFELEYQYRRRRHSSSPPAR